MSQDRDRQLTQAVKAAIEEDRSVGSYGVSVHCNSGVVILQGVVDVLEEKTRAGEIAAGVPGVSKVENAITMSTDGQVNDEGVISEVVEELEADNEIDTRNVGAYVYGGTVFLKGRVDTPEKERHVIEVASKARGVKQVVSQLEVGGGSGDGMVITALGALPMDDPRAVAELHEEHLTKP